MDKETNNTNSSDGKIKRFFYLLGQAPRIINLVKELWSILMDTEEQQLLERIADLENATKILKGASSAQKQQIAADISEFIRRLQ